MAGLLEITFDTDGTDGDAVFTSDTVGDATTPMDPVKPNAKQTNVGGDFPHLFDISNEKMEKRVCWSSPTRSRTRQGL